MLLVVSLSRRDIRRGKNDERIELKNSSEAVAREKRLEPVSPTGRRPVPISRIVDSSNLGISHARAKHEKKIAAFPRARGQRRAPADVDHFSF